jgi:hypothetical protein
VPLTPALSPADRGEGDLVLKATEVPALVTHVYRSTVTPALSPADRGEGDLVLTATEVPALVTHVYRSTVTLAPF